MDSVSTQPLLRILLLSTAHPPEGLLTDQGHLQDVFGLFPKDCIVCADSEQIAPGRGKPQPDIFLVAAQTLGLDVGTATECTEAQKAERARCVVFEDAIPVRLFLCDAVVPM
jgi:pseudouridine-5'-monophosphatase